MNTSILVYYLSSMLCVTVTDSTTTVEGIIINETSGAAIIFATVSIYQDGNILTKVKTDADGKFVVDQIPSGNYVLEIEHVGMRKEIIRNFMVTQNTLQPIKIFMQEKRLLDDALDVAGEACAQGLSRIIKNIFKRK